MLEPTAQLLANIPELAARSWESRKSRMAADAKVLSNRLAEQTTLNQQAIVAKLKGTLEEADFQAMKKSIGEETARIENDIKALDSERSSMEDLMHQTQTQVIDFAESWRCASAIGKQEIQFALYPRIRMKRASLNRLTLLALQEAFATLIKFGVPGGI